MYDANWYGKLVQLSNFQDDFDSLNGPSDTQKIKMYKQYYFGFQKPSLLSDSGVLIESDREITLYPDVRKDKKWYIKPIHDIRHWDG